MASCSQPPPPAIPSQPSDFELAKMLVDPSALPRGNIIIHDADVYAQDPTDLTRQFAPTVAEYGQKAWYFSTKLLPKNQRGKRKRRCMDSGVWRDEGKSKPVVGSEGLAIGHRSLFSFVNKVDGARTGWIMHEFRLPDGGNEESLVVLCKVFRSSRWCAPNPAMNDESATAEVEVEEEALVKAVEAREGAVKVREEALAAREAAVEAREALARRDAANMAVSERNLQERQSNLAGREEAVEAREVEWRDALWQFTSMLALHRMFLQEFFAVWDAEFAREVQFSAWEAEGAALARRDAARLAVSKRNLQEREWNLAAREAAFETRLQALQEELTAELEEALVVLIIMAALLVARAGLQFPIAGGSSPELPFPIAVDH